MKSVLYYLIDLKVCMFVVVVVVVVGLVVHAAPARLARTGNRTQGQFLLVSILRCVLL